MEYWHIRRSQAGETRELLVSVPDKSGEFVDQQTGVKVVQDLEGLNPKVHGHHYVGANLSGGRTHWFYLGKNTGRGRISVDTFESIEAALSDKTLLRPERRAPLKPSVGL